MKKQMRQSTLETLGLGSVLDIFINGKLPVTANELVDKVFGTAEERGSLVISGANGIVGAGKAMQLGSRLQEFDVPVVALDFPGVSDGIAKKYTGLVGAFGRENANQIMGNIIKLSYDGKSLPKGLAGYKPRFLLEAIPEILEVKKQHYKMFRDEFPDIKIKSVTSGFPSSSLGVGVAHPAFPHEINKVWEIVEEQPSDSTKLLWALGMIPMNVSDDWAFVLDVLFCGITSAATRYCDSTNMPYWKADKYVRKYLGCNPFRAHDAIGATGANFLTWSCLHHLGEHYGDLFTPSASLVEKKDSGMNWYPLNHFRPLVDWAMNEDDKKEFDAWVLGGIIQMTSLMLHENRSHLSQMNLIGEICAQFKSGVIAMIRELGADKACELVNEYHKLHPEAKESAWYPEVFENIDSPEWQQLYVNAEHDGKVGVISINRESYNHDVDKELNRAIDWLNSENINSIIVTGDFHFSTQMVGADTTDFFAAIEDTSKGIEISATWSATARRLYSDFDISVGYINGKRCLGGYLELMMHCDYLIAEDNTTLGMPEVTLPVIPGMEGCHWLFRKMNEADYPKLLTMLLTGKSVKAKRAVGWLTDFTGSTQDCIKMAWKLANGENKDVIKREINENGLESIASNIPEFDNFGDESLAFTREAMTNCIVNSCEANIKDALAIQANISGNFMTTKQFKKGTIGTIYAKTCLV